MVLAGDIGGTNCRYALFDGRSLSHIQIWPTKESTGVAYDLKRYQDAVGVPFSKACLGIAGPVSSSEVSLTNAHWRGSLSDVPVPALFVNDLQAAIQGLGLAHTESIWGPAPKEGHPLVALGIGTGFGQALRFGDQAFPAEGGHASFAPNSPLEFELLSFLSSRLTRVRVEDVCSGIGMEHIVDFLSHKYQTSFDRNQSAGFLLGVNTQDPILSQGLDLFLSALGSVIADTALRQMPLGGIWLCGGVAQKMRPHYKRKAFLDAFSHKQPMNEQVASIPVSVVLEEELGLLGAGCIAHYNRCGFAQS